MATPIADICCCKDTGICSHVQFPGWTLMSQNTNGSYANPTSAFDPSGVFNDRLDGNPYDIDPDIVKDNIIFTVGDGLQVLQNGLTVLPKWNAGQFGIIDQGFPLFPAGTYIMAYCRRCFALDNGEFNALFYNALTQTILVETDGSPYTVPLKQPYTRAAITLPNRGLQGAAAESTPNYSPINQGWEKPCHKLLHSFLDPFPEQSPWDWGVYEDVYPSVTDPGETPAVVDLPAIYGFPETIPPEFDSPILKHGDGISAARTALNANGFWPYQFTHRRREYYDVSLSGFRRSSHSGRRSIVGIRANQSSVWIGLRKPDLDALAKERSITNIPSLYYSTRTPNLLPLGLLVV